MISVTELRAGTAFKLDGQPHQVIEYKHTKIARGTANIKIKARNLSSGTVVEKTFTSGAKVEPIETDVKTVQYLYQKDNDFYFMDPRSFEQFSLDKSILGEKTKFLKEESQVKVLFHEGKPLSLELPLSMIFKVVETPPGVKGDSATASAKPVTLENGLITQAPLFIKKGDKIKIDTRTGKYIERVAG